MFRLNVNAYFAKMLLTALVLMTVMSTSVLPRCNPHGGGVSGSATRVGHMVLGKSGPHEYYKDRRRGRK